MPALLALLLRDSLRHPLHALLTLAGIAGGVAVVAAIDLASEATRDSFRSTVEGLAGRATHQVTAANGLSPARLADLAALPGVEAAHPAVERLLPVVEPAGLPPVRLVGIDPFLFPPFAAGPASPLAGADLEAFVGTPFAIALPQSWLQRHGLKNGQRLRVAAAGRPVELVVLHAYANDGFGAANDNIALADVATAQEIGGQLDRIDRIDLILTGDAPAAVAAVLAGDERLEEPQRRGARAAGLLDAFRFNLLALGALALLVGSFLVYNAAEFAVVRRRVLLGRLRCLGCTTPNLLGALLTEAGLFALAGGLLGLGGGRLLAQVLVGDLARTVQALYGFAQVRLAPLDAADAALALAAALGLALCASLFPALDAASTAPRQVLLDQPAEDRFWRQRRRLLLAAAGAALLAAGALLLPTRSLWPAYLAVFASLVAGAALLPPAMRLLLPRLARFAERRGLLFLPLAAGEIDATLSRSGPAAACLAAALAMAVAVITMVSSFEKEVIGWIESTLEADIYVSGATQGLERDAAGLPAAAVDWLRRQPQVRASETLRGAYARVGERDIFFAGVSPRAPGRPPLSLVAGDSTNLGARLAEGRILVSQPLATHYGLQAGDSLRTRGRGGPVALPVAGIFRDFSTDRGYALLDEGTFLGLFGETGYRSVALYLKAGEDPTAVGHRWRAELASDYLLDIQANAALRAHVLQVFGQTFAVTFALAALSTLLALVGLATTLSALLLERRGLLAVLRALGTGWGNALSLFWLQALLLSAWAVAAALPLGALLALLLVEVVNWRSFGWSIPFAWPWGDIGLIAAAATVTGLLAGLFPLFLARRQSLSAGLRSE